jgi:hypothetical protein
VPLTLVVPGLVLELVDADLGALGVLDDLGGDGRRRQRVRSGRDDTLFALVEGSVEFGYTKGRKVVNVVPAQA